MPFSNDAEKGVLSCFLHNPAELLPDAQSTMEEEWFYHPANRLLFQQMLAMFSASPPKPVEYIALTQHLQDNGMMDKVGGQGTIAELLDFVPTPTHYGYYKGILRDKWLMRMAIGHCTQAIAKAYEAEAANDVTSFLTWMEAGAFDILQAAQRGDNVRNRPHHNSKHLAEWLNEKEERWRNRGTMTGIVTGLHDLDRSFHGLDDREGEVVVVAARPGQGKTAFLISVLHHIAVVLGIPTAVFSIEMTASQLNDRLVLGSMGIDTQKGNSGMFSRDEWKRLGGDDFGKLSAAPVWLDASSEINSADLRIRCQTLKRQHGIRVVVIDYLALVEGVTKESKSDERLRIVEVMRTCAWIAKELKCVVLVAAQLNRETDRNRGKPPVLADLLGSSSIEATAHSILFLHRPETSLPWHRMSEDAKEEWRDSYSARKNIHAECWGDGRKRDSLSGMWYQDFMSADDAMARQDWEEHAMLFIAKNRRGPTPEIWLRYRKEFTWFSNRTPKLYSNNPEERQVGT